MTIRFSKLSRKWEKDPKSRKAYDVLTPEFEAELRRLVQEGIDSGPGVEGDAVFALLHARFDPRGVNSK